MMPESTSAAPGNSTTNDPARTPGSWAEAARPALQAWVTARVIVLAALGFAHYLVDHLGAVRATSRATVQSGLLSWDASWYSEIASKGYAALPREALRFFPGIPLATRLLGWSGIGNDAALVGIANVSALAAGVLLYRLIRWEGLGQALAVRAVWLLALAPPAYVFVMGYTDATTVALAIAAVYALRRRSWGWAIVFALLAGLCRPTAFLLLVPAAIEGAGGFNTAPWQERLARIGAVIAAPTGTLLYLGWVGVRFGDMMLPFSVQTTARLRGRLTDPFTALYGAGKGFFHDHIGTALHVPWFVILVVLTVIACRRLPLSYGAFAVAVVASSVTSHNLDSLERYALLAFPLVIAAGAVSDSPRVERMVFALVPAAMFGYATLAFLGLVVP